MKNLSKLFDEPLFDKKDKKNNGFLKKIKEALGMKKAKN